MCSVLGRLVNGDKNKTIYVCVYTLGCHKKTPWL